MTKMKTFIIMTRGFTASGKTTVAKKLANLLENTDIYHSALLREELGLSPEKLTFEFDLEDPFFVKVVSPIVYSEMARKAIKSLEMGRRVILDAAYNFPWQRSVVYAVAQHFGVPIYVLKCECTNEEEIARRLDIRQKNAENPFNEAPAWKTYLSTVKHSVNVEDDRLVDGSKPKVVEYDTYNKRIRTLNIEQNDEIAREIIRCLES